MDIAALVVPHDLVIDLYLQIDAVGRAAFEMHLNDIAGQSDDA